MNKSCQGLLQAPIERSSSGLRSEKKTLALVQECQEYLKQRILMRWAKTWTSFYTCFFGFRLILRLWLYKCFEAEKSTAGKIINVV